MRRSILFVVAILLLLGSTAIGACKPAVEPTPPVVPTPTTPTTPTKPEVIQYLVGSTSTSSGAYAMLVANVGLLNKYVPEVNCTLVETGSTHDNLVRVKKGELHFGNWCTDAASSYFGVGKYEGDPYPKLRTLYNFSVDVMYWVVRADSGVRSLQDLDGKGFFPSIHGGTAEFITLTLLEKRGIKPELFIGDLGDAVQATKDRRIVGYLKAGPYARMDATILETKMFTDIYLLPLTDEELAAGLAGVPGIQGFTIPAGEIPEFPDLPAFNALGFVLGMFATTDIPQDIGYKFCKAALDHWDVLAATHAGVKVYKPIEYLIRDAASPPEAVPLHAGTVQYLEEKGIDVPAKLIPPEYKR